MKLPITLDFETEAIGTRPEQYPPKPVGLAIWEPGKQPRYLSWGHPTENNGTWEEGMKQVLKYWDSGRPLLFHNAPFDIEVAMKWFGVSYPHWERVHDTQVMAFLHDPHAKKLELKDLADVLLDMPPEEQDELRDWVFDNVPGSKRAKTKWGAHIREAPGNLVGKYAKGDVVRTRKLFDLLKKTIPMGAYNRERELQPHLLASTIKGVPIAKVRLEKDLVKFSQALKQVDGLLRDKIGCEDLDLDSPKQLVDALDHGGFIDEWVLTAKGARSAAAKALQSSCNDKQLVGLMSYRARLKTGLRTFGGPWLDNAYDGKLHFKWNQTTGYGGAKNYGARTGRLSSSPNAQNMPAEAPSNPDGLPALPHPRWYVIPEKGQVLLGRDYSQQELRILAWYLGGPIAAKFIENPRLDLHEYTREEFNDKYNIDLPRKSLKMLAFGILYGMGRKSISKNLEVEIQTGSRIIDGYKSMFTGLLELQSKFKEDEGIYTWGGRWYDVEPPIMETIMKPRKGRLIETQAVKQNFYYKLLNYAIQGSAAEAMKQALINMFNTMSKDSTFLITVHDEILISAPTEIEQQEMKALREAMLGVDFDGIAMVSDGKRSLKNWASMRESK